MPRSLLQGRRDGIVQRTCGMPAQAPEGITTENVPMSPIRYAVRSYMWRPRIAPGPPAIRPRTTVTGSSRGGHSPWRAHHTPRRTAHPDHSPGVYPPAVPPIDRRMRSGSRPPRRPVDRARRRAACSRDASRPTSPQAHHHGAHRAQVARSCAKANAHSAPPSKRRHPHAPPRRVRDTVTRASSPAPRNPRETDARRRPCGM